MSDFTGIIVVIVAVVCMYLAQRKSATTADRRVYSLLGSVASVLITFEAARRGASGVSILFASAAVISLMTLVFDYLSRNRT